jgi:L-amino acid N-acyltransferase YncA
MEPAPVLRLATPADGAAVAAVYGPYVTASVVSFEAEAPSAAEMAGRIERTVARTPWIVAEVDGSVRAYAYGTRHRERAAYDWTVETTVYVDEGFLRRGLGRAAMEAVHRVLRLQGAHLAVAGITLPNPGSVGLHLALGYRHVGAFEAIGYKFGAWHGVDWYALELGPRPDIPAPLVPLPELLGDPRLAEALQETPARTVPG